MDAQSNIFNLVHSQVARNYLTAAFAIPSWSYFVLILLLMAHSSIMMLLNIHWASETNNSPLLWKRESARPKIPAVSTSVHFAVHRCNVEEA